MTEENIVECFCVWTDLLGFGSAFEKGQWSFQSDDSKSNIERLRRLENSIHRTNDPRKEVAFVLNDGLARVYDLPDTETEATALLWWFHNVLSNHWLLNAADKQYDSPGARTVLSFGERIKDWKGSTTYGDHFLGDTPLKKIADNKVCIYSPDEFQLNLALSKAYTMESGGSSYGLKGPGLFVDVSSLDALKMFLESREFDFLKPIGSSVLGNHGELHFAHVRVNYKIELTTLGDMAILQILRKEDGHEYSVLEIEFDAPPIQFSKRGLTTELWKVKRYKPIDEDYFCFDFDDYSFL